MLSFGARRLPPDFSLEAADCLSLYSALETCRERLEFDLDPQDPTRFFGNAKGSLLKQKDILRYEAALIGQISAMIDSTDPQDQKSVLNHVIKAVSDPLLENADQTYIPNSKQFYANLITLVSDLHASGDLVCMNFAFPSFCWLTWQHGSLHSCLILIARSVRTWRSIS